MFEIVVHIYTVEEMSNVGAPEKYNRRLIVQLVKVGQRGTSNAELRMALRDLGSGSMDPDKKPPLARNTLRAPLNKLIAQGLAEPCKPPGGLPLAAKTKTYFHIRRDHATDVAALFFPWDGQSIFNDGERGEFLCSEMCDDFFSDPNFLKMILRLFIKWAVMWPDETRLDIARFFYEQHNSHPDVRLVSAVFDLLSRLKLGDPTARARFNAEISNMNDINTLRRGLVKLTHLSGPQLNAELADLKKYARLSISLVAYASGSEFPTGVPPTLLFDFRRFFRSPNEVDVKSVGEQFLMFLRRIVFVSVTHDLLHYSGTFTTKLLRQQGIETLAPLLEKVAKSDL